MALPLPRYTRVGLDGYLAVAPVLLPLPPGEPEAWTCLFCALGPALFVARDDRGSEDVVNTDLLRALLEEMGRPTRGDESVALLSVSPVPASASPVRAALRLLSADSYGVRWHAALLLGHLGDRAAVRPLIGLLADSDNDVRRGAAEALGRLGDPAAIPALASKEWGDSDSSVDAARVEALVRLRDWARVEEHLREDEDQRACDLVRAILAAERGGDASGVAELLECDDEHLVRAAATWLKGRPELARRNADALVRPFVTGDGDGASVRLAMAVGAAGEEVVEPLIEALDSSGWRGRMFAAIALGACGPAASAATEALERHLDDDDNDVRRESALALAAVGPLPPKAAGMLARERSSDHLYPERAAALAHRAPALAPFGMIAGTVPPDRSLASAICDTGAGPRERGLMAMLFALIEPDLSAPLLDAMARDDARDVPFELRRAVAAALLLTGHRPSQLGAVHRILLCHEGSVSSSPQGTVEELYGRTEELAVLASKDGDWPVRLDALRLLQALGAADEVPTLLEHISRHDPDGDCRAQARAMLAPGWRSPSVGEALAGTLVAPANEGRRLASLRALVELDAGLARLVAGRFLDSDNRDMARASARLLGPLATREEAPAIVALALARLDNPNWVVREAAAELLGEIDRANLDEGLLEEIVDALQVRFADDSDNDVRNASEKAIRALGFTPRASEDDDEDEG